MQMCIFVLTFDQASCIKTNRRDQNSFRLKITKTSCTFLKKGDGCVSLNLVIVGARGSIRYRYSSFPQFCSYCIFDCIWAVVAIISWGRLFQTACQQGKRGK